ncbi:helix-turn-helix domain-containing protein [Acinetobacter corruptisaponis]|uniref:Helix-turn-helix domain-containing protein n=1 Tax=Acinetobacter corruptisaponis TaxID=3045147 RepID=A0ABY8S8H4_9GAMM|nr:helix-turn-helix domain-containing protein [Acinetobacter sp. KCTC 92772]WHP06787.1 helix-turn-helix domain-containing protein [Acinetobacter sp. KCTC 92772]
MNKFNFVKAIRMMRMPATTKLVAMTLATYADYKTGECYPTVETLMEDTGLSNRAVCQHIRHIESLGILAVDRSNGRRSYYKFIAENLTKAVTESHQLLSITSDFDDIQPVTFTTEPVTFVQKAVTESHTNYHKQPIELPKEQPDISAQEKTEPKPKKPKSTMTTLPADFKVSDQVKAWASEKGFDRLDEHLENFVGYATANAKKYADWDQAFMNAIRGNWAKLRPVQQSHGYQTSQQQTASEQAKWNDFLNGGNQFRDVTPKKTNWIEGVGHA